MSKSGWVSFDCFGCGNNHKVDKLVWPTSFEPTVFKYKCAVCEATFMCKAHRRPKHEVPNVQIRFVAVTERSAKFDEIQEKLKIEAEAAVQKRRERAKQLVAEANAEPK